MKMMKNAGDGFGSIPSERMRVGGSSPTPAGPAFFDISTMIFLPRCIGCDAWLDNQNNAILICPACIARLNFLNTPAFLPQLKKRHFEETFSCLAYEGLALDWIHQYKFHHKLYLVGPLAALLSGMRVEWKNYDAFVYVPLHWWRQMRRGFNPSHLLAHALGKKFGTPVLHCLKKSRATTPQTKLTQKERLENVHNAFSFRSRQIKHIADKKLLLIDDVLTTGSTINECAKVLKKSGAGRVDVLTLARTI